MTGDGSKVLRLSSASLAPPVTRREPIPGGSNATCLTRTVPGPTSRAFLAGSRFTNQGFRFFRFALLVSVLALAACASPSYYWQASKGHLGLMSERREVGEVLADPETSGELRARLELSAEILEFAERELSLPSGDSYRTFVEIGGPVTWNVVAAPEFSLQPKRWCFPVAGCVSYRGYFHREDAETFAARMSRKGWDVTIIPALAYSTLGWFDDPLLDTLLRKSDAQLAGTLFHELAHQRLYVRDSTHFNEAYASFVETSGVKRWFQSRKGDADDLERWERGRQAVADFDDLLRSARLELQTLYASGLPALEVKDTKRKIFETLRDRYDDLVNSGWQGQDYFSSWMAQDLNNAALAGFSAYTGGRCAFAALLAETGQDFARFHERAAAQAGLDAADRERWLNQPCAVIASPADL